MEVIPLIKGATKEIAIVVADDSNGDVDVPLPSEGNLLAVSVGCGNDCPRLLARLTFESGSRRVIHHLKTGYMKTIGGIAVDKVSWDGRIRFEPGFENFARGRVYNRSGGSLKFSVAVTYEYPEGKFKQ